MTTQGLHYGWEYNVQYHTLMGILISEKWMLYTTMHNILPPMSWELTQSLYQCCNQYRTDFPNNLCLCTAHFFHIEFYNSVSHMATAETECSGLCRVTTKACYYLLCRFFLSNRFHSVLVPYLLYSKIYLLTLILKRTMHMWSICIAKLSLIVHVKRDRSGHKFTCRYSRG